MFFFKQLTTKTHVHTHYSIRKYCECPKARSPVDCEPKSYSKCIYMWKMLFLTQNNSTEESYPKELYCVIQPLEALIGLHHCDTKTHCTKGYPSPPPHPHPVPIRLPSISYIEQCVSHLVLYTLS